MTGQTGTYGRETERSKLHQEHGDSLEEFNGEPRSRMFLSKTEFPRLYATAAPLILG